MKIPAYRIVGEITFPSVPLSVEHGLETLHENIGVFSLGAEEPSGYSFMLSIRNVGHIVKL
jgi:hypothetical protein